MGELFAVSRGGDSSGPSEASAGATIARGRLHKDAARTQTAILFGLLLAVQFAAAALTPLGSDESDSVWDYFMLPAIGFSVAWPALLAVWAVFGPQRAAVRLPLTLWLAVAVNLAELYGLNRNASESGTQLLFINAAWLLAFGVLQAPLWLIRAVRRWRLELTENGAADAETGRLATKSSSQFSLRAMFGWTLAIALLLAEWRWLAPGISLEMAGLRRMLPETVLIGFMVALGGLPVIALAWIVLADSRRLALRIVLSLLVLLGVAGAAFIFRSVGNGLSVGDMLTFEAGAMFNGLVSFVVVRACGYRLRRRSKNRVEAAAHHSTAPAPSSRRRFAFALAPLIVAAAGLACSVPHRIEQWRRAEIVVDWRRIGFEPSFADDGTITSLKCDQDRPLADETCRRIAGLADVLSLDLSRSTIDDRQLALLAPLARLEKLDLSATAVTEAGLNQLRQFPQLIDLNLTNMPITDAGLERLKELPKLQTLQLSLTENFRKAHRPASLKIDACDALLGRLPSTTRIHIPYASGSQRISVSPVKPERLHARAQAVTSGEAAAVSDAGLVSLAFGQTELEELDLRESAMTDSGLSSLRKLQHLKRLDLRGAPVTEQGVSRLARLLPECEVLR